MAILTKKIKPILRLVACTVVMFSFYQSPGYSASLPQPPDVCAFVLHEIAAHFTDTLSRRVFTLLQKENVDDAAVAEVLRRDPDLPETSITSKFFEIYPRKVLEGAVTEIEALGGKVVQVEASGIGGRLFFKNGVPFLALSPDMAGKDSARILGHELDHLKFWLSMRDLLISQRALAPDRAGIEAQNLMSTPHGIFLREMSAKLAEINIGREGGSRDTGGSIIFLSHYPLYETLHGAAFWSRELTRGESPHVAAGIRLAIKTRIAPLIDETFINTAGWRSRLAEYHKDFSLYLVSKGNGPRADFHTKVADILDQTLTNMSQLFGPANMGLIEPDLISIMDEIFQEKLLEYKKNMLHPDNLTP